MLPNPEVRAVTIEDYYKIFIKRIGIIGSCVIVIPLLATISVFVTRPVYRASTSISLDKGSQVKVTKIEGVYNPENDPNYMQTQIKILGSGDLIERAFHELRLENDPEFKALKNPIAIIRGRVKVDSIKNSNVLVLSVEDTDALRAASLANAIVSAYIQKDIEARNRKIQEAGGWLENQLSDLKKKIQDAETALNVFIRTNKISGTDFVNKAEDDLQQSKNKLNEIDSSIAELSQRYKTKHPKMIALYAKREEAITKVDEAKKNLAEAREKSVQYNILKKDVDSNQELYKNVLARSKEAGVVASLQPSNVRIVESAQPPGAPFKPEKAKTIIMAIVISLVAGGGLALLLEYLDATIRTAEEVGIYINLPFLGYIPKCDESLVKTEKDKYSVCQLFPTSPVAESYRALRTSVIFSSPEDKPLKNILITSSVPGEGKSFISANISWIFSHLNEKIILIDVDMRRPKLHNMLSIEQKPGLSTFLAGKATIDEIIKPVPGKPNLSIIPSGTAVPNPSELLSSGKTSTLIEILRTRFDRIILDSPPILSAADTSLLANMVDGVILVIKGASTRYEAVLNSKKKILEAKGKIIGVIVNNIQPEKEDRYYYYHYYYSEGKDKTGKKV